MRKAFVLLLISLFAFGCKKENTKSSGKFEMIAQKWATYRVYYNDTLVYKGKSVIVAGEYEYFDYSPNLTYRYLYKGYNYTIDDVGTWRLMNNESTIMIIVKGDTLIEQILELKKNKMKLKNIKPYPGLVVEYHPFF